MAACAFVFGFFLGRVTAPEKNKCQDEADWWKRGEEPPEWK